MIAVVLSLLIAQSASAVSTDPHFLVGSKDRDKYTELALRSTVAVVATDDSRRCTGTLVSPGQVLTSAHCFDPLPGKADTFQIYLMNDVFTVAKTVAIKEVHVHPLWVMGRKSIEDFNRQRKNLYAGLGKISLSVSETCPLRGLDWESYELSSYLKDLADFMKKKPAGPCQKAVQRVGRLLAKNKFVLDKKPMPENETRLGDVAVADLAEEVNDGFHKPMAIDFEYQPEAGDTRIAFVMGFGMTSEKIELAKPINPLNIGYSSIKGAASDDRITIGDGAVICPGDSGGPTAYVKFDQMQLIGINAGTTACNYIGNQSESVSVRAHADWILSILAK
jgi:hypothetical protein